MITVVPDIHRPKSRASHDYSGPLIDFLVDKFPNGFGSERSAIFVNRQKLEVRDYDRVVGDCDDVVIMTSIPAGEPISTTAYILYTLALTALQIGVAILLAPKKPKTSARRGQVYEIGSGQNIPALGEVIPEHFGRLWFFPDVASQPYSTFENNEQYLHQLLLVGQGMYDIEDIRIGNTNLSLIPPGLVEYTLCGPDVHLTEYGRIEALTGIHEDVVTSNDVADIDFTRNANDSFGGKTDEDSGLKLTGTEAVTGFVPGDVVTLYGLDIYYQNHDTVHTVTTIQGNKMFLTGPLAADARWYQAVKNDNGWRGWFEACGVGKQTERVELDFELPNGLCYLANDGGIKNMSVWIAIEIQRIDDVGGNIGPPIATNVVYTAATRDAVRRTEAVAVPLGRYKVRCRRQNADDIITNTNSRCYWTGLKAYITNTPGQYTYGDATIVAMRIKASPMLSSSSEKISMLAVRKLMTAASDYTIMAPTTNVVDAFAHIVRESDPFGIDAPQLKDLAARWNNTNGFNWRFDEPDVVYNALQAVAASHRAAPQAYARKLSMRPDDPRPFDQYVVTQEQMTPDSFLCQVTVGSTVGLVDGLRVEYQEATGTTNLYVVYPTTAVAPEDVTLVGCTDEATAVAFAQYAWTKRVATRRTAAFNTEWDSLVFAVGDRVCVVSNVVDEVRTVRVLSANGLVLTVDGLLEAPALQARVRDEYGGVTDLITASMTGNQLTLSALPPFPIYGIDSSQEPTTVVIGTTASFSRSYVVTKTTPSATDVAVEVQSYTDAPYAFPIPGDPGP